MEPSDFLQSLKRMRAKVARNTSKTVSPRPDRNIVRAHIETWFRECRPAIVRQIGETPAIEEMDQTFQDLLRLTHKRAERRLYKQGLSRCVALLEEPILVQYDIARWTTNASPPQTDEASAIIERLGNLQPEVADSYRQILSDLGDEKRLTFKGTANELRELLRVVLVLLAPEEEVCQCSWFKEKRVKAKEKNGKRKQPERAERIRYILEQKTRTSRQLETAQKAVEEIDAQLGSLALPLYAETSDAAHRGAGREDVIRTLRYLNAVLLDILPE